MSDHRIRTMAVVALAAVGLGGCALLPTPTAIIWRNPATGATRDCHFTWRRARCAFATPYGYGLNALPGQDNASGDETCVRDAKADGFTEPTRRSW